MGERFLLEDPVQTSSWTMILGRLGILFSMRSGIASVSRGGGATKRPQSTWPSVKGGAIVEETDVKTRRGE